MPDPSMMDRINQFLADPQMRERLQYAGIGAGVGAGGMALADAMGGGDEDEADHPGGRQRSLLRSMALGGALGGVIGGGGHWAASKLNPAAPKPAPGSPPQYRYDTTAGKLYSGVRGAVGSDPDGEWNQAGGRGVAVGGLRAVGAGLEHKRLWMGDKALMKQDFTKLKGTDGMNEFLGDNGGKITPEMAEKVRVHLASNGAIPQLGQSIPLAQTADQLKENGPQFRARSQAGLEMAQEAVRKQLGAGPNSQMPWTLGRMENAGKNTWDGFKSLFSRATEWALGAALLVAVIRYGSAKFPDTVRVWVSVSEPAASM